jgi:hypothetical protein
VTPRLDDATAKAIYIRALQGTALSINGDFVSFRRAIESAADIVSPTARATVVKVFDAVGIGYACAAPPAKPTLDVTDLLCNGKLESTSRFGAGRYLPLGSAPAHRLRGENCTTNRRGALGDVATA